jgi:hypothetical protein
MLQRIQNIPGVRLVSCLMLLSGWGLVMVALAILKSQTQQGLFVLAGFLVEIVGLVMLCLAHRFKKESKRGD